MAEKIITGKTDRTRKALKDAFVRLYEKKDIAKISVREITEQAGVTRSTFYVYFESVYDLLEQIEHELEEGLGDFFGLYNLHKITDRDAGRPFDSTMKWFAYCMDNKDCLITLMGPHGDPAFEYRMRKRLKGDIIVMMDKDGFPDDVLRKYIAEYMASATLSLVRYWLENGENDSAGQIAVVANMMREGAILQNMYKGRNGGEKID